MFQLQSDVFETSTTTGTGAYSLAGVVAGYNSFASKFDTGDTPFCRVEQRDVDGVITGWELGRYTLTEGAPDTLARTEILGSSNGGAAVNWGAGTKNIMNVLPAEIIRSLLDEAGVLGFVVRTAARIYAGIPEAGVGGFRAHAQAAPNMTVRIEAGRLFLGGNAPVEVAAANTSTITAPSGNPRIDRIVLDPTTGAVSVVTGAEAGSPTAPNITAGKVPIARVALSVAQSTILDSHITDERSPALAIGLNIAGLTSETTADDADLIAIYDNSVGNLRKQTRAQFLGAGVTLGLGMTNGKLDWSVNANALTVALKTAAGADPSAADPVKIRFRHATGTDGSIVERSVTSALSVVVSSGSTLGTVSQLAFKVWCIPLDNAGAVELGVAQSLNAGLGIQFDVDLGKIGGSTAEGGAGGADSAGVLYSTTARSNVAIGAPLGYAEWISGLTTAGTWSTNPTTEQPWGPGIALPGEPVQSNWSFDGAVATGSTQIPSDDTIPQNTEGDQYMSVSIGPVCHSNILEVEALAMLSLNGIAAMTAALFVDSTANALAAATAYQDTSTQTNMIALGYRTRAGTLNTFKLRAGAGAAATTTFNGRSSARLYGGVANSFIRCREIMT